jgi:hypothetical protein
VRRASSAYSVLAGHDAPKYEFFDAELSRLGPQKCQSDAACKTNEVCFSQSCKACDPSTQSVSQQAAGG